MKTLTADERLALVRIKIERAKEHLRYLESRVRPFLDTKPYVVGTKRNPQTRQLIYYVDSVRDVPIEIAAIIGDVLQNLRSALDHLAHQLVIVGTGAEGPFTHVYFPIFDNATEYKSKAPGKIKGMRKDAVDAIDAVKPYKGGNDTLWLLHKLNNIDKHRLVITVGSAFHSIDLGGHIGEKMRKMLPSAIRETVVFPAAFFKSDDRLFPLKQGDELFIDGPDAEVNEKLQFRFQVAFGEPQVIEGKPLLETLQQMLDLVNNIISSFGPLLV